MSIKNGKTERTSRTFILLTAGFAVLSLFNGCAKTHKTQPPDPISIGSVNKYISSSFSCDANCGITLTLNNLTSTPYIPGSFYTQPAEWGPSSWSGQFSTFRRTNSPGLAFQDLCTNQSGVYLCSFNGDTPSSSQVGVWAVLPGRQLNPNQVTTITCACSVTLPSPSDCSNETASYYGSFIDATEGVPQNSKQVPSVTSTFALATCT